MTTQMSEEARRKRNEYSRTWRQKNPDKTRQYVVNYWERKAAQVEEETAEGRIKELHDKGYSLREIGQKLNISHMTVKRLLQGCNKCNNTSKE